MQFKYSELHDFVYHCENEVSSVVLNVLVLNCNFVILKLY